MQNHSAVAVLFLLTAAACSEIQTPSQSFPDAPSLSANGAAPFIAMSLSATERHTCAIAPASNPQCWGDNTSGQVGNGSSDATVNAPARIGAAAFDQIAAGSTHSCALDRDGSAYCWGSNIQGQLGNGTLTAAREPVAVTTDLRFQSIGAGANFTCALATDGRVYCWGTNAWGQLGVETTGRCPAGRTMQPCSTTPVAVSGGRSFAQLHVGLWNGCGVTDSGAALCWGSNHYGQLGVGTVPPVRNPAPRAVSGGLAFDEVSVGAVHMCGIANGNAYCWGTNFFGTLGSTAATAYTPTAVAGGHTFKSVEAGDGNVIFAHTCALTVADQLYCWGSNRVGQLGVAVGGETCSFGQWTSDCARTPIAVTTSLKFNAVDLGNEYSCGITRQRQLHCWGSNANGRLGSDVAVSTSVPTAVDTWSKAPVRRGAGGAEAGPAVMD